MSRPQKIIVLSSIKIFMVWKTNVQRSISIFLSKKLLFLGKIKVIFNSQKHELINIQQITILTDH